MCRSRETTGDYGDPFKLKFSKIPEPDGRKSLLGGAKGHDSVFPYVATGVSVETAVSFLRTE